MFTTADLVTTIALTLWAGFGMGFFWGVITERQVTTGRGYHDLGFRLGGTFFGALVWPLFLLLILSRRLDDKGTESTKQENPSTS